MPSKLWWLQGYKYIMRCLVFILIILINGIGGFFNSGYSQELDRSKFQPSSLVSRETAEKQLNRIYQLAGKLRTFHCGCVFDKIKQVFPNICASDNKVILEINSLGDLNTISKYKNILSDYYNKSSVLVCCCIIIIWHKQHVSEINVELQNSVSWCAILSGKFKVILQLTLRWCWK